MSRLSLPTHGALELLVGLSLLGLAFALGLGAGGLLIAVAAGTVVAGVGLSGGESLPLRTHQALDQALVAGMLGSAVAMVLVGEAAGAVLLGAAAAAELILLQSTRWTRRR